MKKRQLGFEKPQKAFTKKRKKYDELEDSEDENVKFNEDLIYDEIDEYNEQESKITFDDDISDAIESDHEDEVFSLGLSDDHDSDIEGLGEESYLPDRKAWGKSKKLYYNTDYVEEDWGAGYKGSDEEQIAEMEEQEAKAIQQRLLEELRDEDFGIDFFTEERVDIDDSEDIAIKKDLSMLSKEEKLKLLQSEAPEFNNILKEFRGRIKEIKDVQILVEAVKAKKIPNQLLSNYISIHYRLLLNYLVNLSFYIVLKSNHTPVDHHPIVSRLANFSKLLGKLAEGASKIQSLLQDVKERLKTNKPILISHKEIKKPEIASATDETTTVTEKDGSEDSEEEVLNKEDEKRGITYQIAKNKGLTVKRKKEVRNPRVKYRNRYVKAKIRRKGMVREPRKELERYGGEISGIKSKIVKSVVLK